MRIEPPSLNIPLEQNESWRIRLLFAYILSVGIAAFFDLGFSIVLAAAGMVVLPAFWLLFFPPYFIVAFIKKSCFGTLSVYAFLFTYLSFAKHALIPFVTGVLERVLF